jgi:Spy/CpxP family protein refolding chaperone
MSPRLIAAVAALALASQGAAAQPAPQPYAGMDARPVKALSEQQIAALRTGRGMGLALAAELNGYPGPRHVLELADRLGLSNEQQRSVKALFDEMTAEAVALGTKLIEREAHLDGLFATRTISQDSLSAATAEIGEAQAELRKAHLKYHLLTAALLTPHQVQRYSQLRGYAGGAHPGHHHPN